MLLSTVTLTVGQMIGRTPIRAPTNRECEVCGRAERWNDRSQAWAAVNQSDAPIGDPYCIHEWDINGTFSPYE